MTVAEGNAVGAEDGSFGIRFSRLVAIGLAASVGTAAIGVAIVVLWMAGLQDRTAATGSERMIRGGITALEEKLSTVTMDFAIWPDAVEALARDDLEWVWLNIGISAAITETTDLMMVAPTGDRPAYGWTPGMDEVASTTLLPEAVVARAKQTLLSLPLTAREAPTAYYRTPDGVWLLSAARIVPDEESEVPEDDAAIPRLVYGFRMTPERIAELGAAFLIEDIVLTDSQPGDARMGIPLDGPDGETVAWLSWSPPMPGRDSLSQLAIPVGIGLAVLMAVTAIATVLVIQSAQSLERALAEARTANRLKSEFLANVSHELRTPMNGVLGVGELLGRSQLDEGQKRMIDLLMDSARAQMRLINDLLDLTSLETGQLVVRLEPFAPAALTRECCEILRVEAAAKGLTLDCRWPEGQDLMVLGDGDRFRRIVANLVGNAVKFTAQGRVSVTLAMQPRAGQVAVALTVADTGPGIAPEDRERVFERFLQLDGSLGRRHGGTGLGLAITRSLVDSMGGTIELDSAPGRGAIFVVRLLLPGIGEQSGTATG